MTLTTIRTAPNLEDFTTLEDHQSQTPSSFFNAKPILHFHTESPMKVVVPAEQNSNLEVFQASSNGAESSLTEGESVVIGQLDVFVSSQNLTFFNPSLSIGVIIPYPSISLHAISSFPGTSNITSAPKTLYMQIDLSDPTAMSDEDEQEPMELTLIPTTPSTSEDPVTDEAQTTALFTAISTCSNLNPDPISHDGDVDMNEDGTTQGDSRIRFEGSIGYEGISGLPGVSRGVDNGGLPPPFPGSGGWITAENVGEFFDAEGNWIGGGETGTEAAEEGDIITLGEGAGRVRGRDEMEAEEEVGENGVNGHGEEADESKWRRTD